MFASKDIFQTASTGGYKISRSVRLRSSASAYLNRTPAGAGNSKTFTINFWVKRGIVSTTANFQRLLLVGSSTANYFSLLFNGTGGGGENELSLYVQTSSTQAAYVETTAKFRDPSAWYMITLAIDTTQATAANRVKIYINGIQQTALLAANYPSQNTDIYYNSNVAHYISENPSFSSNYFDGYITEFNSIDGQALTPSSFGETNAVTGVWQPKKYGGTYGTNGFYLNFSDNSTAAALGTDFSGNSNTWTTNNISVTAGVTYDSMLDVPTPYADGGNGRGNYAVMNPLDQAGGLVVADGNLKVTAATGWDGSRATFAYPSTGKYYWEATCISRSTGAGVGVLSTSAVITGDLGAAATGYIYNSGDGNKYNNGSGSAYGATWGTNDIIGIAWDADTGTLSFYKNGTSQGTAYSSLTGQFSPAIGVNGSDSMAANFGQRPFSYTPPTGFVALNTQNLPAPTISNGASYMAASLFTGTSGNVTVSNAVNGISFQPDFLWFKARSNAQGHSNVDSVRGANKLIQTNLTNAESTLTNPPTFNSDGFTSTTDIHTNGYTYVAWQWNAGGSTVTNTSGSISAQVRANPTAGFSVVTFTSTGSSGAVTVGHGLGVAPAMVITKERGAVGSWGVYHTGLTTPASQFLNLQTTGAATTNTSYWGNTNPTSTVVTLGNGTMMALNTTMVMYCFAAVAGYSAFGKYTGNGSTDGPFVFTGFRPRFVLFKRTDVANDWAIIDTARNTFNVATQVLFPNSSSAEGTQTTPMDILSNGFKVRNGADNYINANGGTYIYMAFAENPFKISLAR